MSTTECHLARREFLKIPINEQKVNLKKFSQNSSREFSKVSINERSKFRKAFAKFEFGEAPIAVKREKRL